MHRQITTISTPPNAPSRAPRRADARERAHTNPKTTTASIDATYLRHGLFERRQARAARLHNLRMQNKKIE
jgi:hypothetical protein